MLRRPVVFMAGLYHGGDRYELRFASSPTSRPRADRQRARRADRAPRWQRYVATLEALCREAPYNWFNFYDFWADADAAPPTAAVELSGAALLRRASRAFALAAHWRRAARAPAFDLAALMQLLATRASPARRPSSRRARGRDARPHR